MTTQPPAALARPRTLLIGLDSELLGATLAPLAAAGFEVQLGTSRDVTATGPWDMVVSGPALPGAAGMELLAGLRAPEAGAPALLLVGTAEQLAGSGEVVGPGIRRLCHPFASAHLVATAHTLLREREAPRPDLLLPERVPAVSLLSEADLLAQATEERERLCSGAAPGDSYLVSLHLDELERWRDALSADSLQGLAPQLAELADRDAMADELRGTGKDGELLLLLPSVSVGEARERLVALSQAVSDHAFDLGVQHLAFSPAIGFASLRRAPDAAKALEHAREGARQSARHLDLQPALYTPGAQPRTTTTAPPALLAWWAGWRSRHALVVQYVQTMLLGLVLPFLAYWGLARIGWDISQGVYLFVVATLALTAISIWLEGLLALRREDPPDEPARPYPAASAVIAAYLPNEAPIIEDTVRAFLRVQYPGPLQIILAYNTPKDMPEIEERLRALAREHPRFIPMRVLASTSKAQNVNAALAYVTGEMTAVFDADHQPDPDSFRRAWRWISHGADVVQGHCFIRNGDASWVARMVAIEFEQIYAVSHPGRARLHGFGIFGGSNGYWRTELLRSLRMHGFMLTEDIDSSMRAVVRGRRIVSDPYLVSRELAPETLQALTKQRLRWAQGWLQISLRWILPAMRSRNLSLQQKLGMFQLLAWREVYPWLSMQILPLIAFWAVQAGSLRAIDWFVPLFVVTSLFTLSTGPGQILFTWKLADPQLKRHPSWFWFYVLTSTLFYAGLKNAWNRIAHLKEARRETAWVVTTRSKAKK